MTSRAPYPQNSPGEQPGSGGPEDRSSGRGRRSRPRTFIPLAVVAWLVLEVWLLTLIAQAAGGLVVLGVLLVGFVVGVFVIKRAGRRAWRRLSESVQQAQNAQQGKGEPEAESGSRKDRKGGGNALVMLGGLLIMVPGVLSDVAGLLCLFPPTAALMRRTTQRHLERQAGFAPGTVGDAYQQARRAEEQMRIHRPDGKVVEGEIIRDDDPPNR
ncbi:FxsA family membrane protein [Streptomyces albidus (ex Kaewkla and Franco 2022)]|uniref:FxsA family membrane protein n=1 Tax=Streptomyces albidus (ex Kaewkla and Franco 2022) TaxID=722709 RepID=UPI0015EF48CB|nr:FxsA family membrane protein [Streptomyces albidus (ex Kaewkla and Franco 2022)]